MHILTIHGERCQLRQGIVRIEWPDLQLHHGNATIAHRYFLALFCRAADLWQSLPVASVSVRLCLSPDRPLVSYHAIAIEHDVEPELRLAIAAFMRIDGISGATVRAPANVEDYEQNFTDPGEDWRTLDHRPFHTRSGSPVYNGAGIFSFLGDLITKATGFGYSFEYQVVAVPMQPSSELIRSAKKSAAFLRRETSAPEDLVARQEQIANRLVKAAYFADEGIRISAPGQSWLASYAASGASAETWSRAFGLHRPMISLDAEHSSAFSYHLHPIALRERSASLDTPEAVEKFLEPDAMLRRVRCEPYWLAEHQSEMHRSVPISANFAPRSARSVRSTQGGSQSREPFVFVSYAHEDRDRIDTLLNEISQSGVCLWMDTAIDVGEEWDTRLETQLIECAALIAFVSDGYVDSKHCRRELKFADALDKPILAASFVKRPLSGGLGYIFASLQFIAIDDVNAASALIHAIRLRAPQAIQANGTTR
jgi:hypothetical protein